MLDLSVIFLIICITVKFLKFYILVGACLLTNAIYIYIYRRFNAIVSQLKMHYFSEGAFESLIASQLLKKEKYI